MCQWDPFRELAARKAGPLRAIQLGLQGEVLNAYVHDWCLRIDDITDMVHAIEAAVLNRQQIPSVPEERLYPVSTDIARQLGMTLSQ